MEMRVMQQLLSQVCSTATKPIAAPRWRGSAAIVRSVSAVARKRMP